MSHGRALAWLAGSLLVGISAYGPASAQSQPGVPSPANQPGSSSPGAAPAIGKPDPVRTDLMQPGALLGDVWGLRPTLGQHGITLSISETSEVLGNVTGGQRRGAIYEGLTNAILSIDMDAFVGLAGGTLNVTGYQIHGRGLSANDVDNLSTVSSIEADRSLRLFELWYEQSLLGGAVTVRLGQQAADQEFLISRYGTLFVNSQFGWPTLPGIDLPAGGNSFPLATPGVRVRIKPYGPVQVLLAAYNGNPAGKGIGDPQLRDAAGTDFYVDDGVFAIGEVQYARNQGLHPQGLPAIYRIGAYYNSNDFADQALDNHGRSLADPASDGSALEHHGSWAAYGVIDQLVWRHDHGADRGIGLFGRVVGTRGDRNPISLYAEGGLTWDGFLHAYPTDTVGIGIGINQISGRARQLDRETAFFTGGPYPVRDSETDIELTMQHMVAPWLLLQPDFQYVIHPSGGIPNPGNPSRRLGDAAILGLRAMITL